MCVCILNLTSSALQTAQHGTDQCVVTSPGSNSLSYLSNTLSSEYFSKYGGILEIHCADFNAVQSLLHISVKILTAGLIHV